MKFRPPRVHKAVVSEVRVGDGCERHLTQERASSTEGYVTVEATVGDRHVIEREYVGRAAFSRRQPIIVGVLHGPLISDPREVAVVEQEPAGHAAHRGGGIKQAERGVGCCKVQLGLKASTVLRPDCGPVIHQAAGELHLVVAGEPDVSHHVVQDAVLQPDVLQGCPTGHVAPSHGPPIKLQQGTVFRKVRIFHRPTRGFHCRHVHVGHRHVAVGADIEDAADVFNGDVAYIDIGYRGGRARPLCGWLHTDECGLGMAHPIGYLYDRLGDVHMAQAHFISDHR